MQDRKVESGLSWQEQVHRVSGQSGAVGTAALREFSHLLSDSASSSVHGMASIYGNSALNDKQFSM